MAGTGDQSPNKGRFQTKQTYCLHANVDATGSTGSKIKFVVMHPYIRVLGFGFVVGTALGGSTTINAVVKLDKIAKNAGATTSPINSLATLTFDGTNNVLGSVQYVDLDTGQSGTPLAGPPAYPTAVQGDVLSVNLSTAGTGAAAQDIVPFVIYQERPSTA